MNATIRRWPAWSGLAAAGWTVPYLALATAWVLGSTFAYPWRKPDGEFFGGEGAVGIQGWLILPVGVAGVAAALIARRDADLAGPLRRVLVRLALGAIFALAAVQFVRARDRSGRQHRRGRPAEPARHRDPALRPAWRDPVRRRRDRLAPADPRPLPALRRQAQRLRRRLDGLPTRGVRHHAGSG